MRKQVFAIALFALLTTGITVSAQNAPAAGPAALTTSHFERATNADVSPQLRDLLKNQPSLFGELLSLHEAPVRQHPKLMQQLQYAAAAGNDDGTEALISDPVAQTVVTPTLAPASVGINVLGVGVGFPGYTVPDAPTDVNIAVGDTQVVQWVNVSYAVFDKTTGTALTGPILGNTLWTGFPGRCAGSNSGDIIVLWDKLAHRWVMMQPVFSSPFKTCFAISQTSDALGAWNRYEFPQNAGFPDYPKIGIWIDGYYQSNNIFNAAGTAYLGAQPCAYNRTKMLAGDPSAEQICILDNSNGTLFDDSFLPADIDTPASLPPAGTPEVFLGSIDNFSSDTHLYEYTMAVNWTALTGTLTGINGATPITVPSYVGACNFGSTACIPQAGVTGRTNQLDSLGDRLMYRLVYHNSGMALNRYNSFLVSHAVTNNGVSAERWYELRSTGAKPTVLSLYQSGTYAPDNTYRFMGSLAMDKKGNIIFAYSRSSSTLHPDIYFASRAPGDALGTLGPESAIINQTVATGSQSDTSNRWGDYTSMSLDSDGCTMWYTNQYYTTNTRFAWSTRVASLKAAGCQ